MSNEAIPNNLAPQNLAPTSEQKKALEQASEFAHQLYAKQSGVCDAFLRGYPLSGTLSKQQIEDLIQDYTLDAEYQLADEQGVMKGLRQLRNLLMMRWIWQDALHLIGLEKLTEELSAFADGCVKFAKDYVYNQLVRRYGEPMVLGANNKPNNKPNNKQKTAVKDDVAIFAMGKLGAKELNLSSDIDLILVHQGQGETQPPKLSIQSSVDVSSTHKQKYKPIDNKRFMTRLGQGIIKLLDSNTADGFVFRVDMRLRPWGDGSDLAIHESALTTYFSKHGRDWERFAWLKARVINDIDAGFAKRLTSIIKPFVFRYYVDYSAFSALREMKSMIQSQVAQREDLSNIKLGAGGIRDIEFIVQAFQLIYGGRYPQLQVKPCLQAMKRLVEFDLLSQEHYQALQSAYRFLRRLEHGIQAIHDQQTQRLPTDDQWQHNLAMTLRFDDWQALLAQLDEHRHQVIVQFDKMVTYRQSAHEQAFYPDKQDVGKLNVILTADNERRLKNFWASKMVASLTDEARERLNRAYPVMVSALLQHEQRQQGANDALPRLLDLLEAICRRSIYLVMLAENPNATFNLIPMLSASPWIASELARYPVLLDAFLQQRHHHLPDKAKLRDVLQQRLLGVEPDDEEGLLNVLRLFKKIQVMAVASSDVIAERPIMKVSDSLTFIAEVVLEKALYFAFTSLVKRHGYPINQQGEPVTESACGFAIIGYGKLGGIEMSYSSDLDLVFLHQINERAMTTGEKSISGMKFAARLAQKLMNYLSTQTRDGRAYEIDMRLRPSGNAGLMVVSANAFEQYQLEKAWEWEHQALVRARGICGDGQVMGVFERIRRQVLCLPRESQAVKQAVIEMRAKMQTHLGSQTTLKDQSKVHLKQDTGGIVDIEFLAQYAVLAYSHQYPELARWSDNVRIFETLEQTHIFTSEQCKILTDSYLLIRTATHQLALSEKSLVVDKDKWQQIRQAVKDIWYEILGSRQSDADTPSLKKEQLPLPLYGHHSMGIT